MIDYKILVEAYSTLKERTQRFRMDLSSYFINIRESDETFLDIRDRYVQEFIERTKSTLHSLEQKKRLDIKQFEANIDQIYRVVFDSFTHETSKRFPHAQTREQNEKKGASEESKSLKNETTTSTDPEISTTSTPGMNDHSVMREEIMDYLINIMEASIAKLNENIPTPRYNGLELSSIISRIHFIIEGDIQCFDPPPSNKEEFLTRLSRASHVPPNELRTLFADFRNLAEHHTTHNETHTGKQSTIYPLPLDLINSKRNQYIDWVTKHGQIPENAFLYDELLEIIISLDDATLSDANAIADRLLNLEKNYLIPIFDELEGAIALSGIDAFLW